MLCAAHSLLQVKDYLADPSAFAAAAPAAGGAAPAAAKEEEKVGCLTSNMLLLICCREGLLGQLTAYCTCCGAGVGAAWRADQLPWRPRAAVILVTLGISLLS